MNAETHKRAPIPPAWWVCKVTANGHSFMTHYGTNTEHTYSGVVNRTKLDSSSMEPKTVIKPFDRKQVNSRLMSMLLLSTIMTTVIHREGGNRNPHLWKGRLQSSDMSGERGHSDMSGEWGHFDPLRWEANCDPQRSEKETIWCWFIRICSD